MSAPRANASDTFSDNDDDASASGDDDLPDLAAAEPVAAERRRRTARTLVLKGQTSGVLCLAALEGDRLASGGGDKSIAWGGGDKSIIIWNLADGTQLAKLEGHHGPVYCLAALDGDRLASGSLYRSIIIWKLTRGEQLAKLLEGHTNRVRCLAVLDGDRLASGSDDSSIIIWDLTDGTQITKLERGVFAGNVLCLAALDCNRLASGDSDNSVIIWSVADKKQLATFEGHRFWVNCLAALDGNRLASGSRDRSIIVWSLADREQLATLEGHTGPVYCLAALDGGRLASGSFDKSVIIWNVEDCKQLFKLEGHTGVVWSLAALDGGRLASGSFDETIRIRPLAKLADLAACGSTFEFEKVARSHRDKNCLGDLFDAAVVQSEENMGGPSSAAIRQAHVFDAIAKVINAGTDQDEAIDSLVPSVLALELAPSPLFRVVLDAKFAEGPVFVLYFELFLFLVLGCCFTRVVAFEVLGVSKWFAAEMIAEIVAAFVILAWFSARELYQMWFTRKIELATPDSPLRGAEGLAWYVLAIPRYCLLLMILVPLLLTALVCKVLVKLSLLGEDSPWTNIIDDLENTWEDGFNGWVSTPILKAMTHDPLTFLGLPRAWRYDYWNLIDAATIGCSWAAFARAAVPGGRLSADLAVVTAILMWIRFCWYLKNLRLGWAKFVLMIEQIAWDLRYYLFYFLVVLLMFASAFYLYLGPRMSDEFGFHDDGAPSAFGTFPYTIYNLILLGFVGEFDPDNFDEVVVRCLLVFYVLVVMVVLLNVLIAIVSDSYDISMAKAEALYYRSRLELITEMAPIASCVVPKWMLPRRWRIKKRITKALADLKRAKSHDPHRVNYMINRVATIVDHSERQTGHRIGAVETELARIAATQQQILALLSRVPANADAQGTGLIENRGS